MRLTGRVVCWTTFVVVCAISPVFGQDSPVGDWHGVLATPAGDLTLIVRILTDGDTALKGALESPDQIPGRQIPIHRVVAEGGRLELTISVVAATYRGEWSDTATGWVGTFTQGGEFPLTLRRGMPEAKPTVVGMDGAWEGSIERSGQTFRLVLKLTTSERGTTVTLDSPDMMSYGVPVSGFRRSGNNVRFMVPAASVTFVGTLGEDGNQMRGRWARPGVDTAIVTFVRAADAERSPPPERPQTPQPPFPYDVQDVQFANTTAPGVMLAGTLTIPSGTGPFPGAILISGSGAQDRDETIFGHKPFAVLADYLTRRGIAVLRYDDRGFGKSTGEHGTATSADFATDANAAFAFLRSQRKIDGGAIGFIGHSEGGVIGPLAALENADVAFLVLLAGPGVTLTEIELLQRRAFGLSRGLDERELKRADALVRRLLSVAARAASREEAERNIKKMLTPEAMELLGLDESRRDAVVTQYGQPWFRYILTYDPAVVLSQISVPVLAVNGTLDQLVPAGPNLEGIAAALVRNEDATVRAIDGLNHFFQTAETGALSESSALTETFAPLALEIVADWVAERFVSGAPGLSPGGAP